MFIVFSQEAPVVINYAALVKQLQDKGHALEENELRQMVQECSAQSNLGLATQRAPANIPPADNEGNILHALQTSTEETTATSTSAVLATLASNVARFVAGTETEDCHVPNSGTSVSTIPDFIVAHSPSHDEVAAVQALNPQPPGAAFANFLRKQLPHAAIEDMPGSASTSSSPTKKRKAPHQPDTASTASSSDESADRKCYHDDPLQYRTNNDKAYFTTAYLESTEYAPSGCVAEGCKNTRFGENYKVGSLKPVICCKNAKLSMHPCKHAYCNPCFITWEECTNGGGRARRGRRTGTGIVAV